MPSDSFVRWSGEDRRTLDAFDAACLTGGLDRDTTRHLNYSYTVLLSAYFQGFCRALHEECLTHFLARIGPVERHVALREALTTMRKLDRGNPNPGNIGSDFGVFGLSFWDEVDHFEPRNEDRRKALLDLNEWRNAISHNDFTRLLNARPLRLGQVRRWRSACNGLTASFDEVMRRQLLVIAGSAWQE